MSKVDLVVGHLCLVVVLAVLLRRVDLRSGHLWKVVVLAFLLCKVDLGAVHFSALIEEGGKVGVLLPA